jgi:hypothetical protein
MGYWGNGEEHLLGDEGMYKGIGEEIKMGRW